MIETLLVGLGVFLVFILSWFAFIGMVTKRPKDSIIWSVVLGAAYIIGRVVGS